MNLNGPSSFMSNLLLKKLGNFVRLTEHDRHVFAAHAPRIQRFEAHEDLVAQGDDPRYVNMILEGWAYRYKMFADGRRQIISFFVPGDMCDPVIFFVREMSHSLASFTQLTVARLNQEEMNDVRARSPALATAFWIDMLVSAEIQREWTINMGRRTAAERMAHLFCELALRLKIVGLSDGLECELPVTQADLADALGMSTVHINRTLQDLRGTGLVELRSRKLTIYDEQALRDLAMFDPSYLHLSSID